MIILGLDYRIPYLWWLLLQTRNCETFAREFDLGELTGVDDVNVTVNDSLLSVNTWP